MFGRQPGAQLGQRRMRLRGDMAEDRFMQVSISRGSPNMLSTRLSFSMSSHDR
jgi:hypothetical protein